MALFRSDKPKAQEIQDWVFEEVLPALEQTGTYSLTAERREFLGIWNELTEEQDKAIALEREVEILRAQLEERDQQVKSVLAMPDLCDHPKDANGRCEHAWWFHC